MLWRALAVFLAVISRRAGDHLAEDRRAQTIIRCLPAARAASNKAAKMLCVIHEQHAQPFASRPHRAGDASRRAADDDEVIRLAIHLLRLRGTLQKHRRRNDDRFGLRARLDGKSGVSASIALRDGLGLRHDLQAIDGDIAIRACVGDLDAARFTLLEGKHAQRMRNAILQAVESLIQFDHLFAIGAADGDLRLLSAIRGMQVEQSHLVVTIGGDVRREGRHCG